MSVGVNALPAKVGALSAADRLLLAQAPTEAATVQQIANAVAEIMPAQRNFAMAAVSALLAAATDIVDVFVEDTRLDSDGGAHTARCSNTTFFGETLGTATRGARRDIPKVKAHVLRAASWTIYDLTDLDGSGVPRMWMVFTVGASNAIAGTPTSIFALNGRAYITTSLGLYTVHFPLDYVEREDATTRLRYKGRISQRNAGLGY